MDVSSPGVPTQTPNLKGDMAVVHVLLEGVARYMRTTVLGILLISGPVCLVEFSTKTDQVTCWGMSRERGCMTSWQFLLSV